MKLSHGGQPYGSDRKHFCIVTNRPGNGSELIRWHRGKAGTIEDTHHVLTNELAAEALPSQNFGANAAWLRLNVLLYNLPAALRRTALPEELRTARPKRLRFLLFNTIGRVIRHARETLPRANFEANRNLPDLARSQIHRRADRVLPARIPTGGIRAVRIQAGSIHGGARQSVAHWVDISPLARESITLLSIFLPVTPRPSPMSSSPLPTAVVVVPSKNEGPKIAEVIRDIQAALGRTRYKDVIVLVVDDSSDDTRAIAEHAGAIVLRGSGEGLGAAMYRGLKMAVTFDPDVILAIDGDGQADSTAEISRFLAPIEAGEADLVVGSRFLEPGLIQYKYRWLNRLGTVLLARIMRAQTGLRLTDSHGGIRAMRPEVAADLEMLGTHTYVQETIIDAAEKGFRVKEIPSVWRQREIGTSRVVGSIPKYVFYTLPILLLRSGQHIRVLYSLGLCALAGSFALFGIVVAEEGFTMRLGHRTPALLLVGLLFTTGLQLFFFGFVLQLLKQIKRNVDRAALAAPGAVFGASKRTSTR